MSWSELNNCFLPDINGEIDPRSLLKYESEYSELSHGMVKRILPPTEEDKEIFLQHGQKHLFFKHTTVEFLMKLIESCSIQELYDNEVATTKFIQSLNNTRYMFIFRLTTAKRDWFLDQMDDTELFKVIDVYNKDNHKVYYPNAYHVMNVFMTRQEKGKLKERTKKDLLTFNNIKRIRVNKYEKRSKEYRGIITTYGKLLSSIYIEYSKPCLSELICIRQLNDIIYSYL